MHSGGMRNSGHFYCQKVTAVAIGIVQIAMAAAALFLRMQIEKGDGEITQSLGIFAAITDIFAGLVSIAIGVGGSTAFQLGIFTSSVSGIVSILAATVQAIANDSHEEDPVVNNHILMLLPLLCFIVCVMEVIIYLALQKESQYQRILEGSRPVNTRSNDQDPIAHSAARPPAYSNPPPYTERSPLHVNCSGENDDSRLPSDTLH